MTTSRPLQFTAHNIEFAPGDRTMDDQPLVSDWPLVHAALRTLRLAFGRSTMKGLQIVDLGALEGGYTVEFARAGFDVQQEKREAGHQEKIDVLRAYDAREVSALKARLEIVERLVGRDAQA